MNCHRISIAAAVLLLSFSAHAQGTRADYERANELRKLTEGKVFKAQLEAHWLTNQTQFWYRNDLANGRREFVLVDAE